MRAQNPSPRRAVRRTPVRGRFTGPLVLFCVAFVPIATTLLSGAPVSGAPVSGAVVSAPAAGAAVTGHDNTVYAFGTASFHGSTARMHLNAPIVGMAPTADGKGYWIVASDGGVFGFNAPFYGSLGAMHLNAPIIGMAATPTGKGYWLVAADGGVFTFGDARFFGSTGAMHLNAPVTQLIPGPKGKGYWLMARDGGVFTFGSAQFHGSMGATHLNAPIIGMAATPSGKGYWLVGADGGVFTFGAARFFGSTGSQHVTSSVVGLAATSTGRGYWLATQDGGVYHFGDAQSAGGARKILPLDRAVSEITSVPGNGGYRLLALPKLVIPPLGPPLGPGATGPAVVTLQLRLLQLGFWLPGVSGVFDSTTQQAVWAFQKWNNLPRSGVVDLPTNAALATAVRPVPRSKSGYVIEIDKTRQVLIVANNGAAQWVFNASSGSDHPYTLDGVGYSAHTPEGLFKILRQVDGFDKSPLGELYRPKYFTDTGIAVHGYTDVPPYPASHGCVRVSDAAIDYMWANNVLPLGATVWVYV